MLKLYHEVPVKKFIRNPMECIYEAIKVLSVESGCEIYSENVRVLLDKYFPPNVNLEESAASVVISKYCLDTIKITFHGNVLDFEGTNYVHQHKVNERADSA